MTGRLQGDGALPPGGMDLPGSVAGVGVIALGGGSSYLTTSSAGCAHRVTGVFMQHSVSQIVAVSLLGGLGFVVGLLTVYEVWQWRRRRSPISLRQLVVRVIGGVLLLGLLCKVLGGLLYVQPGMQPARLILNYWAECVALGWLLLFVVLIDLRLVLKIRRRQQQTVAEITNKLIETFRAEHGQPDAVRPTDSRAD